MWTLNSTDSPRNNVQVPSTFRNLPLLSLHLVRYAPHLPLSRRKALVTDHSNSMYNLDPRRRGALPFKKRELQWHLAKLPGNEGGRNQFGG